MFNDFFHSMFWYTSNHSFAEALALLETVSSLSVVALEPLVTFPTIFS